MEQRTFRPWVWTCARWAVHTFYHVDRIGPALPAGGMLLVANHPNTLLDPAVVHATAGRPIRFLAKSTLFGRHPLGWLVRRSGAIPVYRAVDAVDTAHNAKMFVDVQTALAQGEAICLFPEGISHDTGHLEPLRTGAARMALQSARAGHPIRIVPVGLNFDRQSAFRSRVTAAFGRPIEWRDIIAVASTDEVAAVRMLTERIGQQLRHVMVEADPRQVLPIITRLDRLYASARGVSRAPEDRLARRRLIAAGIDTLRERDPERLEVLLARVRRYSAELERFGLRDRDVGHRPLAPIGWRIAARESMLAMVLVPVAAAGIMVFAVPYWVTGHLGRLAPDLASRATWQVLLGVIVYGVWIVALIAAASVVYGTLAGAAGGIGLTTLAFLGLLALERERAVLRAVRALLALRLTPLRARAKLRHQRDDLATVMEQVGRWLQDDDAPA